jgi:aspartyl-tRNA(Asn)/glutamyl-tRNA(Gln) amidotransferase subunit C
MRLARLEIPPDAREKLSRDLAKILEYVGELGEVDTAPPLQHGSALANQFREDEGRIDSFKEEERLLEMAPGTEQGYFKVPRILE